ncbi:MAG TPA: 1,4-alpha-glucan branching protein GlgB [Lacipirellulaceae bacterium]|nr:1,4-alpha-glucan branching protein GlgB [Lacipirellulaceae bacterium]
MSIVTPNHWVARVQPSLLTDDDVFLFNEGTHYELWKKLGSHLMQVNDEAGAYFAVWAPNAERVAVIGDFNDWDKQSHPLAVRGASGIWEGFIPGLEQGACYKYHIVSRVGGYRVDKADPYAFRHEVPPRQASQVWDLTYEWGDDAWMKGRGDRNSLAAPMSIYEMHLGSWRRNHADGGRSLTYRELAYDLAEHVRRLGFTHVELLPVMEHPFYGSWGYQTTGYYAPTSRYGTPQDFKFLVDYLHQQGIGVILDWVPSHFPHDEHGLAFFDGTHLFEHSDARQRVQPDWNSYVFNYGRTEVRSFLISNARYWLDEYHVDGLRVDAVASMLYLDYSRQAGQWVPNKFGGRENLESIAFLRQMNEAVYAAHPDVQTIAEESTAWPGVSRPTYVGGLGFGLKWDMGWMHDTLAYLAYDPVYRKHHHNALTFRMLYAFQENFMMPLSHDEVVHGKGSLLQKMPGDEWQKFAGLRLLLSYMYASPGKKLLFMGAELGGVAEWNHEGELPWQDQDDPLCRALSRCLTALNERYRDEPALHQLDCDAAGFEWIDTGDSDRCVISFLRRSASGETIAAVLNFTPVPRLNYQIGAPRSGHWRELFNSDAKEHGGAGYGNFGGVEASPVAMHGRTHSLTLTLPPLGAVFLKAPS